VALQFTNMLNIQRTFHTSAAVLQRPEHPSYPEVDFAKVNAGKYAIIDPIDPTEILYISEKEYLLQIRVHLSQDVPLVVLCRPGEQPVAPHPDADSSNDDSDDSERTSKRSKPASKTTNDTSNEDKPSQNSPLLLGWNSDHSTEEMKKRWVIPRLFPPAGDWYSPDPLARAPDEKSSTKANHPWHSFLSWHVSRLGKWMKSVDGKGGAMVTPTPEAVLSLIEGWGFDLNFRLGGPLEPPKSLANALTTLAKDLTTVLKTRGPKALILKMKNTLFFLDKWVGGMMNDNPFLLGEPVGLSRSGLPRIIPLVIRRRIAAGDVVAIRLMQSILVGYKVFEGPYDQQDLQSVTGGLPPQNQELLEEFRKFCDERFWPMVRNDAKADGRKGLFPPKLVIQKGEAPYIPMRAGPNGRVGLLGAHFDAIAWDRSHVNWPLEWAKHVGDVKTIELFSSVLEKTNAFVTHPETVSKFENFETSAIALLREPAGKVRTIAIVDFWTQRLMKPVHDWMMSVLSCLTTDATFQQEDSLEGYVRYMSTSGGDRHWSIDLKSATDLIPITLYQALFEGVWGKDTTDLWISLLTDRWFRVPDDDIVQPKLRGSVVRYGRGQPMGTLSSWASMALVHHALELFSAWKAGIEPETFFAYRVLGDDNVTGDGRVAVSYLEVTKGLGVPTSPAKTLEGKLFTFASQKFLGKTNLSPLSLKEEIGIKSTSQRLELALRAVRRGWLAEKPTVARFLRLLLRRRDYVKSTLEWNQGRLGARVQAALISAFGMAGRLLKRLGYQASGSIPFLLAVQGRVQALAGDERHLDSKIVSYIKELDLLLATVTARRAITKLRDLIKDLKSSHKRFSVWDTGLDETGLLPRASRIEKKRYTPNLPGKSPYQKCGAGGQSAPPFSMEVMGLHDRAIWLVIWDSFASLWKKVYPDLITDLMKSHRQAGGGTIVSVTFGGETLAGPQVAPERPGGRNRRRKRLGGKGTTEEVVSATRELESDLQALAAVQKVPASQVLQDAAERSDLQRARDSLRLQLIEAEEMGLPVGEEHPLKPSLADLESRLDPLEFCDYVLHVLKDEEEITKPDFDPWRLVDLLFEKIGQIPLLPEFKTLKDLEPDRSPRAVDLLRSWTRSMTAYDEVMRYVPLAPDFLRTTQLGSAVGELSLRDEALLATSPKVVSASRGQRRSSRPGHLPKKRK